MLLAAEMVAGAHRTSSKGARRWRDPLVIAVVLFGAAILLSAISIHALTNTVASNSKSRSAEIAGLEAQIASLNATITSLQGSIKQANDRISTLQAENAYLITLVQRLCAINPSNKNCNFKQFSQGGGTQGSGSSSPRASPSPSGSSPSPRPSPSHTPEPSPTPTLLPSPVPPICPGHGLPCI